MENYKEKYEDALERARVWKEKSGIPVDKQGILDDIFPELKESDDEQIKNEIIDYLKGFIPHHNDDLVAKSKLWIAWLEKQGKIVYEYEEKLDKCACTSFDKGYKAALLKQGEQKPADKVEPKFKVGDWITDDGRSTFQILKIENEYYITDDGDKVWIKLIDKHYHLWTIQDAKDGDVLANGDMVLIFKCLEESSYRQHIIAHIGLDISGNIQVTNESWNLGLDCAKPATKEQRDLLFQKMHEAGYKWDAEKKELKKMKQEQTELPNDEDYGIDSLYHAARILEKTLGDVEGYQSDDGILEHKCAIEAVKRLYKQKPAWSEEDEKMLKSVISSIRISRSSCEEDDDVRDLFDNEIDWLESLEERMKGE